MNGLMYYFLPILQISLLDIVLSGDNVGVIALAIRNIDPKKAKLVSMIGISGAIIIRIFFASILTVIMGIGWLPIKLIGGLLLLKITWNLINEDSEDEDAEGNVKSEKTFWRAVFSIILADISMGLDNVLAIAGAANGSISLIAFGVIVNIPIIFFGSQFVADLMKKYKITIYVGGAILMHTALAMILEDKLLIPYVSHILTVTLPWLLALTVLIYGCYKVKLFNKLGIETKN